MEEPTAELTGAADAGESGDLLPAVLAQAAADEQAGGVVAAVGAIAARTVASVGWVQIQMRIGMAAQITTARIRRQVRRFICATPTECRQ